MCLKYTDDKGGDIKSSFLSTPSMPVTTMALQGGIPEHFAQLFHIFTKDFTFRRHFQDLEKEGKKKSLSVGEMVYTKVRLLEQS